MSTQFYVKNERRGDAGFSKKTRKLYKRIITMSDQAGSLFHTATSYVNGVPTKYLTILKRV